MNTRVPTVLTNFDGKCLLHHYITLFEGWELEKRWFYERRSTSEYFGDWVSYTVGGCNHAHHSWFDMPARKYPPRMAFLPQETVLGETVTVGIFQSTLRSHPPMHRRKHRAAAAALHWHRRRNELASKIMLVMIDFNNMINGFIVKVLSVTITSLPSPTTAGENLAPLCQVLNQTWAYKCFLGFGRVIFAATFWECSSNTLTIFWQHL